MSPSPHTQIHRQTRLVWLGLVVCGLTACGRPDWRDLALAEDWSLVAPADDPWPGRPPEAAACPERTAYEESGSIEIDTNLCDWVTLTAPARWAVAADEPVQMLFFHSALAAEAPTEAVMAIAFGETEVWSLTSPVPSASAFFTPDLTSPVDVEVGDPLVLHVHNHGANTYQLGHLRAWTR